MQGFMVIATASTELSISIMERLFIKKNLNE